jgi:hypothetical protein
MKHSAVCVVLVLSSLTLAAKGQNKTEASTLIFKGNTIESGCPIGMHATQSVWDHSIKVRQGQQEQAVQPFGQRILLLLEDSHPDPIISATVKVHGLTGKNRIQQTAGDASTDGDAIKIMRIMFGSTGAGGVSGDLYAQGFTSVSSIELLDVSYNDGKTWKIGGSSTCRVTPDSMMLIANH